MGVREQELPDGREEEEEKAVVREKYTNATFSLLSKSRSVYLSAYMA